MIMTHSDPSALQSLKIQLAMVKKGDRNAAIARNMALTVIAATFLETIDQPGFPTQPGIRLKAMANLANIYKRSFYNESDYALSLFKSSNEIGSLFNLCETVLKKDIEEFDARRPSVSVSATILNDVTPFNVERLLQQFASGHNSDFCETRSEDLSQYAALREALKLHPDFSNCLSVISRSILNATEMTVQQAEINRQNAQRDLELAMLNKNATSALLFQSRQNTIAKAEAIDNTPKKPRSYRNGP
jgi:hypothetical protein